MSTMELQLAFFDVCVACRCVRTLGVFVNKRMPRSLWGEDDSLANSHKAHGRRLLPALQAAGAHWKLPAGMLAPVLSESGLLKNVEWIQMTGAICGDKESYATLCSHRANSPQPCIRLTHSPGRYFRSMVTLLDLQVLGFDPAQSLRNVSWPSSLRQLFVGCVPDQVVDLAALPRSLERLALGRDFNQPIESVCWPVSLTSSGGQFDQPIADVVWPPSLLQLSFGDEFNQEIANVTWPASLKRLVFGSLFDRPIRHVKWPTSLRELAFPMAFNQPIADVVWPEPLTRLGFGTRFHQTIKEVVWPACLLQLTLGENFNQPITDVVWPKRLNRLDLGDNFDQRIFNVAWPVSLLSLTVGSLRRKQYFEGVVWPVALQTLSCGHFFDQPVDKVVWPSTLQSLSFGVMFDQPIKDVVWPHALQSIAFGSAFNQPIYGGSCVAEFFANGYIYEKNRSGCHGGQLASIPNTAGVERQVPPIYCGGIVACVRGASHDHLWSWVLCRR